MTPSAPLRSSRMPVVLPGAIFLVVIAALVAVLYLAREAGQPSVPPKAGAFVPPPSLPYAAYDVERADNGNLKVTTGGGRDATSIDLPIPAGTRVWLLEPATPAALKPPLLVNVIAIPNEVRNSTIRLMAFAPAPAAANFESGLLALADGFFGYETSRDTRERAVGSALLQSFDGRNGLTTTSSGPGTLYVEPDAPMRLLRAGTPAEIQPGDRLAVHTNADGTPDLARGVLVLTGGAR